MISITNSRKTERAGRIVADIYLDACCFIHFVEGQSEWRTVVERRLRELDPLSRVITSRLSRLECRTKPTRDGNRLLLERYHTLFGADRVAVLHVSKQVIDRATDLRARHAFKTPDAIHLATALESSATEFWTGDAALSRCTDIAVTVLLSVSKKWRRHFRPDCAALSVRRQTPR